MIRAYPIFQKSDAVFALRQHIVQYGAPRVLSSDNGGEFCSAAVDELRREFRILRHDRTVPESSHQNPAERAIQTANAAARKVFAVSNVPRPLRWCMLSACSALWQVHDTLLARWLGFTLAMLAHTPVSVAV